MIKPTRKNNMEETAIQVACYKWFRNKYIEMFRLLFAVVNENESSKYQSLEEQRISGNRRRQKGVTAGVSDMILLLPRGGYGCLCIEMKAPDGVQSEAQKIWQNDVEKYGNKYVLCRSLDEFQKQVEDYLNL